MVKTFNQHSRKKKESNKQKCTFCLSLILPEAGPSCLVPSWLQLAILLISCCMLSENTSTILWMEFFDAATQCRSKIECPPSVDWPLLSLISIFPLVHSNDYWNSQHLLPKDRWVLGFLSHGMLVGATHQHRTSL